MLFLHPYFRVALLELVDGDDLRPPQRRLRHPGGPQVGEEVTLVCAGTDLRNDAEDMKQDLRRGPREVLLRAAREVSRSRHHQRGQAPGLLHDCSRAAAGPRRAADQAVEWRRPRAARQWTSGHQRVRRAALGARPRPRGVGLRHRLPPRGQAGLARRVGRSGRAHGAATTARSSAGDLDGPRRAHSTSPTRRSSCSCAPCTLTFSSAETAINLALEAGVARGSSTGAPQRRSGTGSWAEAGAEVSFRPEFAPCTTTQYGGIAPILAPMLWTG